MIGRYLAVAVAVLIAALFFSGQFSACLDRRDAERDAKARIQIQAHVDAAVQANKDLVAALKFADALQKQADEEKAKADALQADASALEQTLQKIMRRRRVQRPPANTLDECKDQLQENKTLCDEHVGTLTRAFDLQKATAVALRTTVLDASMLETHEERTARLLEHDRAEDWKKSAKRHRRQKILIGVGAGLGGVALTLGAAYAADKVGNQ